MNPEFSTVFAPPDPSASPLNLIQLFQLANTLVSTTIVSGDFIPYVMSSGTPNVDDQDKAWIELDTAGRPKSIKIFYNGNWRRIYNGMLGEVRGFSGVPGYNGTGNFDLHGLGNIGGDYDGWHICNGQNGTPDLSNQFLTGANMNVSGSAGGYDTVKGWQTSIDKTPTGGVKELDHTGGAWTTTLEAKNIPLPVLSQTFMTRFRISAGGETADNAGLLWGVDQGAGFGHKPIPGGSPPQDGYTYPPSGYAGNPPKDVFVAPPFYSLAWIIFVGYA